MKQPATSIAERLAVFYGRLGQLPPARSAEEALQQICDTLETVEDEMSGVPRRAPPPYPPENDGRMYPPQGEFVVRLPDGAITALTRKHKIHLSAGGTIEIQRKRSRKVEFTKPGAPK